MHDPNDGPNSPGGLSAYKVRRHLRSSMERLGTDHVEVYFMHHIDRNVTWEEMWDVFEHLYRDGLIDYVGTSNFPAWAFSIGQEKANQRHFFGIAVEEHLYNLFVRNAEQEVLPAARAQGIGIMTWSPLAGGRLTRAFYDRLRSAGNAATPEQAALLKQLDQYHAFCSDLGVTPENAGLAWLLSNPAVTAPSLAQVNAASSPVPSRRWNVNSVPRCWLSWTAFSRRSAKHPRLTPGNPSSFLPLPTAEGY